MQRWRVRLTGLSDGGLGSTNKLAIDNSENIWISSSSNSSVSKFSSAGTPLSSSTGYTGGGLSTPVGIAIDGSGNAWVANQGNNSITELTSAGVAVSSSSGFTGSGMNANVTGIAIDGSGDVWVANSRNYCTTSITEFIGAATPVVTPLVVNLISPYSALAYKP